MSRIKEHYHEEITKGLHSRDLLLEAQILEPFELERYPEPNEQTRLEL